MCDRVENLEINTDDELNSPKTSSSRLEDEHGNDGADVNEDTSNCETYAAAGTDQSATLDNGQKLNARKTISFHDIKKKSQQVDRADMKKRESYANLKKPTTLNFTPTNCATATTTSNEQALLSAIYNTIAISLLVVCIGLFALSIVVLQAFVRSIIWAVLTSAFLFSFKRYLTDRARDRLKEIEQQRMLAIELTLLPFKLIDSSVDGVWTFIRRKYRIILLILLAIGVFHLAHSFYQSLIDFLIRLVHLTSRTSHTISSYADTFLWQVTCTLLCSYILAVAFYWNESYKTLFQILSLPVWSSLIFLFSKLLGTYRPVFLLVFIFLICLGIYSFVYELIAKYKRRLDDGTTDDNESTTSLESNETSAAGDSSSSTTANTTSFFRTTLINIYNTSMSLLNENPTMTNAKRRTKRRRENSDKYFIFLFWLFVITKLRYDFYILIPLLVLIWKLLKFISCRVVYEELIVKNEQIKGYFGSVWEFVCKRKSALAPKPFIFLFRMFQKGDLKLNHFLQGSMDNLVSSFIIVSLVLFVIVTLIILIMQVQAESGELITIVSSIMNDQIYSNPELKQWVPEKERVNKIYQSMMNNFYLYGREWLSKSLRSTTSTSGSISANNNSDFFLLETQILEQWDSLYAYLSRKESNFTNDRYQAAPFSVPPKSLLNETHRTIGTQTAQTIWPTSLFDLFNSKHLALFIKDNLGIFMSILDSLYQILKGNINLLLTIFYTLVSTIFAGGFVLVNFFVSFIVYMSALFYLLSMSSNRFKPLEWLSGIRLPKQKTELTESIQSYSNFLSNSIEESIRSVFLASLKMAVFYGLYTYLINCLFDVSIVYLTAIIAALFAFLPLLGTYWVALPGILELWLVQGKPILALVFLFMHFFPYVLAVDQAIYSEIKVGHPYLTGLAFAGGVYCLGLEGALIGPIVLCLLIVIGKMITSANFGESFKSYQQLLRTPSLDA